MMTDADIEDENSQRPLCWWDELDLNKHYGCTFATGMSEQTLWLFACLRAENAERHRPLWFINFSV